MSEGFAEQELPSYDVVDAGDGGNNDSDAAPEADAGGVKKSTNTTNSSDLDVIFDNYDYVPKDLKPRLMKLGATLDKLLAMRSENIMAFAKIDPSMTTDLILFVQALKEYKRKHKSTNQANSSDDDEDDLDIVVTSKHKKKKKKKENDDDGGVLEEPDDDEDPAGDKEKSKEPAILEHADPSVKCFQKHNLIKVNAAYWKSMDIPFIKENEYAECHNCDRSISSGDSCYTCTECLDKTPSLGFFMCNKCYSQELNPNTSFKGIIETLYIRMRYRHDYNFAVISSFLIIFYFGLLIYFGVNIDSHCPDTCDYTKSIEHEDIYYCGGCGLGNGGDICGVNEQGSQLECEADEWPEYTKVLLGILPFIGYIIMSIYFIISMKMPIARAILMPLLIIPGYLIGWAYSVALVIPMQGMMGPWWCYTIIAEKYHYIQYQKDKEAGKEETPKDKKGRDRKKKADEKEKELDERASIKPPVNMSYNEMEHRTFTEEEIFTIMVWRGNWLPFIAWGICFIITYFILIFGVNEIYNPRNHYQCGNNNDSSDCISGSIFGNCLDSCNIDTIGDLCGYSGDIDTDPTVFKCRLQKDGTSVVAWQWIITSTFLIDILIMYVGLYWYCKMPWAKAFVHSLTIIGFVLVGWVPTGWFFALYFLINDVL